MGVPLHFGVPAANTIGNSLHRPFGPSFPLRSVVEPRQEKSKKADIGKKCPKKDPTETKLATWSMVILGHQTPCEHGAGLLLLLRDAEKSRR